jgi:hypothetical protein
MSHFKLVVGEIQENPGSAMPRQRQHKIPGPAVFCHGSPDPFKRDFPFIGYRSLCLRLPDRSISANSFSTVPSGIASVRPISESSLLHPQKVIVINIKHTILKKFLFIVIHFIKFFKPYDLLLYGIFQKPEKSQVNGFLIIL